MSTKKNRRRDAYDWDANETDEKSTNSHNHNITTPADAGVAKERGDSNGNGNGYKNSQAGGGRSGQGQLGNSSQPQHKATLGPWTLAVDETLQDLERTQRTIDNLQKALQLHSIDLESMAETSRMLHQSEELCRQKDEEIEDRGKAIRALSKMGDEAKAQVEYDAAQVEKEKDELKQEREKQDKRVTVAEAEERHKVKKDFEKRESENAELYKKRGEELEDEFARKRDENNKKAKDFEAERKRLSTTVKNQKGQIEAQEEEILKLKEQYDVIVRAKNSIRQESLEKDAELEAMKKEFALDPRPMDYFKGSFADIESQIETISEAYFHGIEGKDLEHVHKELAAADSFFASVPIDDSEVSHDLCTAHAQRVICKAICEDIWEPFSSEFTALQPELSSVLGKISDQIDQSDHGGRTAQFWNARTMRALKSLPATSVTSPGSESAEYAHPARTDSVISKVFVLRPLVNSSQVKSLRTDLVNLVNSAVDVWDNGQAGGMKITRSLVLDHAHREEWRSQQFDPVCKGDEENPDLTSTTRPQIFALFPRVLASGVGNLVKHGSDVPGSWPVESDLMTIHPGKGLPESSRLVVRGQLEQEESKDFVRKALEDAKKQFNTKRASGHGRRGSRGSMISLTLSEQWERGGPQSPPANR